MKSILFVDDEPFVLNSIKRILRKDRHRWETHFAEGGQAALNLLERRSFDLLITDMKMPSVDGFEVLSAAELLHPDMPRMALSGYSEKETHTKVTNLAQRFLDKPCDSEELRIAIQEALEGPDDLEAN